MDNGNLALSGCQLDQKGALGFSQFDLGVRALNGLHGIVIRRAITNSDKKPAQVL
ncbi:MAG TPA: hypothetical protein V6D50_01695 [Chroococcales cyanobacterium]|jgi:hypothetical protein